MTMTTLKAVVLTMTFTLASQNANASFSAQHCDVDFTAQQLNTMTRAYHTGKPQKLGYTLAAISWQESRAGEDVVRLGRSLKEANLGAFQNKVQSAGTREGCHTRKCYANVGYKLLTDQKFASEHALMEMQHWMDYRDNNLRRALASYNSGTNINPKSRGYAQTVISRTKYLQKCVTFMGRPVVNEVSDQVLASNKRTLNLLQKYK